MPSIFISGIPKGLDRTSASLRIRRDIERVAQVRTIGIQKDKGYGYVSLFDETSADFVLSLNERIFINGKALRLTEWKKTARLSNSPGSITRSICKQYVNKDVFVFRGYDTYTSYKHHQPQNDVLYQHIQQNPKKKKLKRKPWKDISRLSQVPSPKSTAKRTKRRNCKKKKRHMKAERSTISSNAKWRERRNLTALNNADNSLEELNQPKGISRSDTETKNTIRTSTNHTRSSAIVHVYDHAKRLFSIVVDNDNVLESIQVGLRSKQRWPSDDTILISYAGKIVSSESQPKMANGDNIHIVVKGKGGMKEGDPRNEKEMLDTVGEKDKESPQEKQEQVGSPEENKQGTDIQEQIGISKEMNHTDIEEQFDTLANTVDKVDQENSPGEYKQGAAICQKGQDALPDEYKHADPTQDESQADSPEEHEQGEPDHAEGKDDSPSKHKQDDHIHEEGRVVPRDEYKQGDPVSQKDQQISPEEYKQGDLVGEKDQGNSPEEHKQDNPDKEGGKNESSDENTQGKPLHKESQDKKKNREYNTPDKLATSLAEDRPTYPDLAKVIASFSFESTFSQGSEASQARLICELGLEDYFPDQLTFATVMSIMENEKEEADTLSDIPRLILRKLIMLDFNSREHDLDRCLTQLSESKENSFSTEGKSSTSNKNFLSLFDCDEDTDIEPSSVKEMRNPLDIFLSIFVCLKPTLKQKVCLKMFACRLAIPLIFPVKKCKDEENVLMFSMWPLRSITVNDGKTEISVVNCKQNVVSFIRLGRPPISKSKLANELLFDTSHHSFFNYDCTLGSSDKQACLGLVEASWFLPSPKQKSTFESVTLFLNLRGDAFCNAEQIEYLKGVSLIMVVVTDIETLKNEKAMDYLKVANLNCLFLITGKIPNKSFIKKYKEHYMTSCPNHFSAEFVHITDKGKNISLSEIKKSVLNTIGPLLRDMSTHKTIQDMCDHARSTGLFVDEDLPLCKSGINLAKTIFDKIKDCNLVDVKTRFSPLQKEFWKMYTDLMKEFCKTSYDLKEKEELKQKMTLQRKQQWDAYNAGHPFMKDVISIIFEKDGDELVHFLDTLKFYLDEKSRAEMPLYRKRFAESWDTLQMKSDSNKTQAQENFNKAEQNLSEASFGIEHIFREMGQIYLASLTSDEKDFGSKLAIAVARSISQGYPFELMDGDVANVPLDWIGRVFDELKCILNNERVLTLSVLGLQSSGKSTLLNAMFGLTFSVSAGRCTRGIYMQLLPVQKGGCKFKYVLVVDTEGLRAPELANQKFQHDNELATLVLGMADITIVNIKGENTSEVKDVLQICVHAFLRLKMANQSLRLRQSCIFIHQNVSDVGAKDSMMHARKKLDETLDRITVEAAEEENITDIKAFKDVINFDSNRHVWYFSDLWKGDPPMAPANPGYSRDVREVKLSIFDTLAKQNSSYLTISDTFVHIKDLWNGILANDFVFSFRNSLEIKAYNALESTYQDLIWELERYKKKLVDGARDKMLENAALCKTDQDRENRNMKFGVIQTEYINLFGDKAKDLKEILIKYFTDSERRDDVAKWKHVKLSSWDLFVAECLGKLKIQFVDMQSHCKAEYEMRTCIQKSKKDIYGKATVLAEKMKGNRPSGEDMERSFNEMWNNWISGINIPDEQPIDIKVRLESILYDTFRTHRDIVDTEIKREPLGLCKSFKPLENSLDNMKCGKTFTSIKLSLRNAKNIIWKPNLDKEILRLTNTILRDIDTRLREMEKKDWKFEETEMKEFTKCILEHIDRFNHDVKNSFTLLEPYKVKLAAHVFRRSLPLFEKLDSEYKSKHSMKTKLGNHKRNVWLHFQDVVAERSATVIASNRFCEVIRDKVEGKVRADLPDSIYENIVNKFAKAKHKLMFDVLKDLANEHNFQSFASYISDPYTYTFNWLEKFIDNECINNELYANNAWAKLHNIFKAILEKVENNSSSSLPDWLTVFQTEIKETILIEMESFFLVSNQQITNMNDFITTVKDNLQKTLNDSKNKLQAEGKTTIVWSGNKSPYQMCMDKLWGCKAMCPFCKEPCQNNYGHAPYHGNWNIIHSSDHVCIQHRPEGVGGYHWIDTNKLVLESCSFHVNYRCSFRCTDNGTFRCDKHDTTLHYHPFREYRKHVYHWNITPCNDISSSLYWAWVLRTFNDEFAAYYGKVKADIPESWKDITKEKAIESLTVLS